jgi:hypothetical protein
VKPLSYAIVLTAPDGTKSAYGPFASKRATEVEQQLQDITPWYSGPIGGPEFDIETVVISKWPGIRAFKKEIE